MIIGIFTDTYLPDLNGVATATKTLRDVLVSKGHRVIIITTGLKGQKKFSYENDVMRVPGKAIKSLYDYRMSFIFNSKAYKILKKIPFDVFHIQQEFPISIFGRIIAKKLSIPIVYTFHTSYENYSAYISKGKRQAAVAKKLIVSLIKRIVQMKGEVITPSFKTRKLLLSYGVSKYINVVPNAIDLSQYNQEKDSEREMWFRKANDIVNKKIVIYLGRLAAEKNVDELINGFNRYKIRYQDTDTVFLIVGDGPAKESLMKEAGKLPFANDIRFLGKVPHDDTAFYYSIADVFLSASLSETQGLTYSEAIESNTIVLAKYDFNLDLLIQDNVTGFYYDDIDSLVDRINDVLTLSPDEKKRICYNAKRRNAYLFSKDTYYERIIHVYKKAIRQHF